MFSMQYKKNEVKIGKTMLCVDRVTTTVRPIRLTTNQKNMIYLFKNGGRVLLCAPPTHCAEPCHQGVLFDCVIAPRSHRPSIWRRASFDSSEPLDLVSSCWNKVDKKICRVEPCCRPEMFVGVNTRSSEEGDW